MGGGGGGGGRIKQRIPKGVGAGGALPPPTSASYRVYGERCKLPHWGSGAKPQKLFKFRIIKLQKDKILFPPYQIET